MSRMKLLLKIVFLCLLSFGMFGLIRKLITQQAPGGFPHYFKDAYDSSVFVRNGTVTYALMIVMVVIIALFYYNFHVAGRRLHPNGPLAGLLYGSSFGMLWFIGFLELCVVYPPSDDPFRHVLSGMRDGLMLTLSGLAGGILFWNVRCEPLQRKRLDWVVIPIIAISFAIFHAVQFNFVFIPLHQSILSLQGVVYLFILGVAIGWMYWLFRPTMNMLSWGKRATYFTFIYFGVNWVLFSSFYLLFLNMPLMEMSARCIMDIAGVFCGLLIFELAVQPKLKPAAAASL